MSSFKNVISRKSNAPSLEDIKELPSDLSHTSLPGGFLERGYFSYTPEKPTYLVRVDKGIGKGRYGFYLFEKKEEAIHYANLISKKAKSQIRNEAALPNVWWNGYKGNTVDIVYVFEVPPKTPYIQGVTGLQVEGKEGLELSKGDANWIVKNDPSKVFAGGGYQVAIPRTDLKEVYRKPVEYNEIPSTQRGINSSGTNSKGIKPEQRLTSIDQKSRGNNSISNLHHDVIKNSSERIKFKTDLPRPDIKGTPSSSFKKSTRLLKRFSHRLLGRVIKVVMSPIFDVFLFVVEAWIDRINRNSILIQQVLNSKDMIAKLDLAVLKNYQNAKELIINQFEKRKLIPVLALVKCHIQVKRGISFGMPSIDPMKPYLQSKSQIEKIEIDVEILKLVEEINKDNLNKVGVHAWKHLIKKSEKNIEWEPLMEFEIKFYLPISSSFDLILDLLYTYQNSLSTIIQKAKPTLFYSFENEVYFLIKKWERLIQSKFGSPFSSTFILYTTLNENITTNFALKGPKLDKDFETFQHVYTDVEKHIDLFYQAFPLRDEAMEDSLLLLKSIKWIVEEFKSGKYKWWVSEFEKFQKRLLEKIDGIA